MYFILFYDYVDNILERRTPYREAHFNYVKAYVERGELLYGGAFTDPADGAALVFKVASRAEVEQFARQDPYVLNGLVTDWRAREWAVVVGANYPNVNNLER